MHVPRTRTGSACALALMTGFSLVGAFLVGCTQDPPPPDISQKTLDDGARPPGASGPSLSSGFDVSPNEMSAVLPLGTLRSEFTEVTTMGAENLIPSEASGCQPDAVTTPSLPATEALATKPPAAGSHQADEASIVAARAPTEGEAEELMSAVEEAAGGCADFSTPLRDLGEGSAVPAEEGASTVSPYVEGAWDGLRVSTEVTLSGSSWKQPVSRESLVLRRGQVVVHVRVYSAQESRARTLAESLATETIDGIDTLD
ncbi:MAG: hypothetical protein ACK5MT_14090 [Actinomycetales bacterium]